MVLAESVFAEPVFAEPVFAEPSGLGGEDSGRSGSPLFGRRRFEADRNRAPAGRSSP